MDLNIALDNGTTKQDGKCKQQQVWHEEANIENDIIWRWNKNPDSLDMVDPASSESYNTMDDLSTETEYICRFRERTLAES